MGGGGEAEFQSEGVGDVGDPDLMVVEDRQSFHSFSFTVELQQTRQSLRVGFGVENLELGEDRDVVLGAERVQLLLAEAGRGVVEVQNGGGRLDDVPAVLDAAEAVVSGQTEVLEAAAAVVQLKHLAGNHRLLLGHADADFPSEQPDAVEVSDGSIHGVFIPHLHQRRPRNALHELHLLHVAVETEEVEYATAVHLGGVEAAHHGNRAGDGATQEGRGGE